MQITKITDEHQLPKSNKKIFTQEELQREYDYIMAEKTTKAMLENSLITDDEFHKITALNRKTFSPYLADLMP